MFPRHPLSIQTRRPAQCHTQPHAQRQHRVRSGPFQAATVRGSAAQTELVSEDAVPLFRPGHVPVRRAMQVLARDASQERAGEQEPAEQPELLEVRGEYVGRAVFIQPACFSASMPSTSTQSASANASGKTALEINRKPKPRWVFGFFYV